jgi:transposase
MRRALAWAGRGTGGDLDALWVIEGTGSYGALLAGTAAAAGYRVAEAPSGYVRSKAAVGKTDALDAAAIATAALAREESRLRVPRQDDGIRAALRVLVTARDQMALERTAKVNALTALVRRSISGSMPADRSPAPRSHRLRGGENGMRTSGRQPPGLRLSGSPRGSPDSTPSSKTTRPASPH